MNFSSKAKKGSSVTNMQSHKVRRRKFRWLDVPPKCQNFPWDGGQANTFNVIVYCDVVMTGKVPKLE